MLPRQGKSRVGLHDPDIVFFGQGLDLGPNLIRGERQPAGESGDVRAGQPALIEENPEAPGFVCRPEVFDLLHRRSPQPPAFPRGYVEDLPAADGDEGRIAANDAAVFSTRVANNYASTAPGKEVRAAVTGINRFNDKIFSNNCGVMFFLFIILWRCIFLFTSIKII